MDFDTYWKNLIDRIYTRNETLQSDEALFYRLSCIYGETMVDGIEAYFERRYNEFEIDMKALTQCGFENIAIEFRKARKIMFGDVLLDEPFVKQVVSDLLDERPAVSPIVNAINVIYEDLIKALDELDEYKYRFGLEKGFYEDSPS